jgi:membrane protein YqaA with SNARE-associated domain
MSLWLLVAGVLIPQEFATTAAVLALATENNLPMWPIHIIWIIASFLDMYAGFALGAVLKKKLSGTGPGRRVDRWVDKFKRAVGEHGDKVSLALLGFIDFPYLNTFLAAWLGIPMRLAFILTLIGNFAWYMAVWAAVLGTAAFIKNPDIILVIVIGIGTLSHFFFKLIGREKKP